MNRLRNPSLWRASALLMLANGIVTLLGLIRTPAITWVLSKEEVGMIGVVAAWMPFVALLSLTGLDSAAFHYVAKGQPWAFVVAVMHRLRWSVLSAAVFLAGAAYWAWRGEASLAWLFAITGISYPFAAGLTTCAGMLSAQERFTGLFWYRIWESLTDFAGFIPLALSTWWVSKAVTFYASNQLATAIMQVGVSAWLIRLLYRGQVQRTTAPEQGEMVRYGKHLTAISAISVLQSRSDAFLVGVLTPLATMADYSIALLMQEQLRRLWNIYATVRYPPLVRLPVAARRRRFLAEGGLVWAAFAGAGAALFLAAYWLIPIILPPSYTSSLGVMGLLIAALVVSIPGSLAELYFRMQQDERRQYLLRIASAVVGVLAPAVLVLRWGAYGAASGRLLASLAFSIVGVGLFLGDRAHQKTADAAQTTQNEIASPPKNGDSQ